MLVDIIVACMALAVFLIPILALKIVFDNTH